MPDIVAMGELLVDFTHFTTDTGETAYKQNAGGAPANVVCMAAKLGGKTGFIGKIGRDTFGFYLQSVLRQCGVDTAGLVLDPNYMTTMAFVTNDEDGERHFDFYRSPELSADLNIRYGEVNRAMIDECRILHFGSLCLTDEPAKAAVMNAVEYAKVKEKIVSYDPNWRPALWRNREQAVLTMRSVLKYVDIVKVSEDELQLLTECSTLVAAIAKLFTYGIKIACITQGAKGCIVATPRTIDTYPAYKVKIVDTLGAGDSFLGGFLYKLAAIGKPIEELDRTDLGEMALLGNACGALTSSRKGAIPAMPSAEETRELVRTQDLSGKKD